MWNPMRKRVFFVVSVWAQEFFCTTRCPRATLDVRHTCFRLETHRYVCLGVVSDLIRAGGAEDVVRNAGLARVGGVRAARLQAELR